jgi:hypothetical protein
VISRSLVGCSVLLLATVAYGGAFQRTKDGKTLVWNNAPEPGDIATWSGKQDANGYATGYGTVTWYRADLKMSVGSNLPSPGQRLLIGRYSGQMVRGKFEGAVVNVDANGKTFHGTFAKGRKTNDWTSGPASANQQLQQKKPETKIAETPAEGPSPSPGRQQHPAVSSAPSKTVTETSAGKTHHDASVKEKQSAAQAGGPTAVQNEQKKSEPKAPEKPAEEPRPSPALRVAKISPEPSAIPTRTPIANTFRNDSVSAREGESWTNAPSSADERDQKKKSEPQLVEVPAEEAHPSPSPSPPDQVVMVSPRTSAGAGEVSVSLSPESRETSMPNRVIQHFKEQTQSTLSRVGDATGNFRQVNRLEAVQKLPPPVSEGVALLANRARDVRSEVGSETALQECRNEIQTVDALSVIDQVTRDMAANDASRASSELNDFLQNSPEPIDDSQNGLWRYLTSLQQLFNRSEKEAAAHIQRGQSLDAANKTSEAIREYQKAYQVFPNPATAEKIRHLQDNSLGL